MTLNQKVTIALQELLATLRAYDSALEDRSDSQLSKIRHHLFHDIAQALAVCTDAAELLGRTATHAESGKHDEGKAHASTHSKK